MGYKDSLISKLDFTKAKKFLEENKNKFSCSWIFGYVFPNRDYLEAIEIVNEGRIQECLNYKFKTKK